MSRILIKGVQLVSMDDAIGVLDNADVLVEDDRIASVSASSSTSHLPSVDETINGAGFILVPGFINAHMHTWQTALRGVASNWTLMEYFRRMHAGMAVGFGTDDIHVATFAGAMNQINCGTTTLADWCHNNPTPEHTDAAVDALEKSGIRAAFFHGSAKPDPKPGQAPFWEVPHPRSEVERLLRQQRFSGDGLLSLGIAILGPHYATLEVSLKDFAMAKELGLTASMHQGGGEARAPDGWTVLEREGLLGPNVNIVHGNGLSADQLARFVDLGMSFSITPESEMTEGHGHPIIGRLRDLGTAASLGIDIECCSSGEMFVTARIALAHQRALDNAAFRAAAVSAKVPGAPVIPPTSTIDALQALRWITVEGARMLGRQDSLGTISPGKQADLVLIDASLPNMQPVHDPINSVMMQASLANIDSVMIAGRWRKRHGRLVDTVGKEMDAKKWLDPLRFSGERLAAAAGIDRLGIVPR